MGYLASAPFALGKGGGVFLHDSYDITPVILVEIIPEPVPSPIGTRVSREGAGELRHDFWEYEVVHLGEVFCLTDRNPVTVYCRICTVYPSLMSRH